MLKTSDDIEVDTQAPDLTIQVLMTTRTTISVKTNGDPDCGFYRARAENQTTQAVTFSPVAEPGPVTSQDEINLTISGLESDETHNVRVEASDTAQFAE